MYDKLEPAFNIIISLHLHKSSNEPKSIFKVHPKFPYHTLRNQVRLICSLLLSPSASQAAGCVLLLYSIVPTVQYNKKKPQFTEFLNPVSTTNSRSHCTIEVVSTVVMSLAASCFSFRIQISASHITTQSHHQLHHQDSHKYNHRLNILFIYG